MRRFFYLLREGLRQFLRSPSLSASAVVAMTASLAVLGLFALVSRNLTHVLEGVEQRKQMSVFLEDGISEEDRLAAEAKLRGIRGVMGLRYVSREEALQQFEKEMGESGLIEALGANPLPASYEMEMAPAARTFTEMERVAAEAGAIDGVEESVYGGEWVRRLDRLLGAIRLASAMAGLLVGLSVIIVISHTIRLTVLAKRDLIEILRLVGASRAFIRLPFVIEGVLQSTAASLLALGLLAVTHRAAAPRLPGLQYLSLEQALLLTAFAAAMGSVGSLIAVRGTSRILELPRGGILGALVLSAGLAAFVGGGAAAARAGAPAQDAALAQSAAPSQQADDTDTEIENRSKELEQIRKEITENRKKIDQLSKEERDNLRSLRAVEKDVGLTERLLRKLEDQERDIEKQLTTERFVHGEVSSELEHMQEILAGRARAMYKRGATAEMELLASSRSFRDLLVRARFISILLDSDRRLIHETRERRAEVEQTVETLERRQEDVSAVRSEKESTRQSLNAKRKQRESATKRVRDQKASYEQAVRELERASAQISSLIARLEQERKAREEAQRRGEPVEPLPLFPDFAKNRNRLQWPVSGNVVGRFGTEKHPKFGTQTRNNGIDIAAPQGTPFRAVAAGRVEFAEWLEGYGNCIILNHGGGYYTLYAHALDLAVRKGQDVEVGHAIGRVGATDSIRGECLHFEVRKGSAPQDPTAWLR